ncbi:MAG: HPP family protein [Candidatus Hydrothermarchaeota archaeon]
MKVSELMTRDVIVAKPNQNVAYVKKLMLKHDIRRVIIVDDHNRAIGIVTLKDLVSRSYKASWRRRSSERVNIGRIMSTGLLTSKPEDEVTSVARRMVENDISGIPVIDEKELVGIITKFDLIRFHLDNFRGIPAREIMSEPITVTRYQSIRQVFELMEKGDASLIVVEEGRSPIGIITLENLFFLKEDYLEETDTREIKFLRRVEKAGKAIWRDVREGKLTVEDLMTRNPTVYNLDSDSRDVAQKMVEENLSGLPIVENDVLVGMVTKTDFVREIAKGVGLEG